MSTLVTAWMLGCVCGFFMGVTVARPPRDRDPDWRRSFNHENTNKPSGPPPLLYQPRPHNGPVNPPPRNP